MNFEMITARKYLQYFSQGNCNSQDELFSLFLTDMETVSEKMDFGNTVSSVEILNSIKGKTGVNEKFSIAVIEWLKPETISCLSAFEIFTLLWFSSKQNVLTFSEEQYLKYANDGTIFTLLNKLKELTACQK